MKLIKLSSCSFYARLIAFKIDSNYRFYTQINNEKKFNKWFNFNIKGKILKINYSYGLSYTLLKKSSDNNLISTSKFDNNESNNTKICDRMFSLHL